MRTRKTIAKFVTSSGFIITAVSMILLISVLTSNISTIFGFALVLFTLWAIKWDWSFLGIQRNPFSRTLFKALLCTLIIIGANDFLIQPIIEHFFGSTNLESFEGLKGNFVSYIVFILIMWIVAAFGEEFLFRGYITKQLAGIMGNSSYAWAVSILISSSIFGLAHLYQGVSGVITTGFIAVILGTVFFKNKRNLWVPILAHGFYDMIGITLIYLDKERLITDWSMEHIFFFI